MQSVVSLVDDSMECIALLCQRCIWLGQRTPSAPNRINMPTKTKKSTKKPAAEPKPAKESSVQTPLETYLREINETALLTAADEKELAGRIADGDVRARDLSLIHI